ncbi:hypothetical protein SAMN04487974_10224 [Pelagibacterium luteolum]|uniref:Uncharacterized protein n=1 Tax=Pelagibacterium luteolum TaxID=440168 RepID=A0A1G7TD02_9HYPH|nr:hypothetical protein SAMN04487974_10224 [Pelagibacterium luteolum]
MVGLYRDSAPPHPTLRATLSHQGTRKTSAALVKELHRRPSAFLRWRVGVVDRTTNAEDTGSRVKPGMTVRVVAGSGAAEHYGVRALGLIIG